ncbi:hypothetical protein [Spirosoma flavum]|uniref:Uncharacterized protein n=1 Tax=Spirosoma flavum TaxID=2048557 RepID=A0ABW6ARG4_9BACT
MAKLTGTIDNFFRQIPLMIWFFNLVLRNTSLYDWIKLTKLLATTVQNDFIIGMLKRIGGVVAGYALFVISSLLLFNLSGQKPHAQATTSFQMLTALYGIIFSFLSGLVVPLIAKVKTLKLNYMLGLIMASFAAFSFFKSEGSHWTQLLAIFIFAPFSVIGGMFWLKRVGKL